MNDLDIIDAEVVEDALSYGDALDGMNALASAARDINEQIARYTERAAFLWSHRAWEVLGHKTWAECVEERGAQLRLPRADRREMVALLDQKGMTTRAIAPVVGANHNTVARDLAGVSNETPDAEPRTKTGLDGKTYTAQPRKPEPPHTVNTDTGEVVPSAAERQAAHDAIAREANAIENVAHMTDTLRRLSALRTPEYRARLIANNTAYPDHEDPAYVKHFNPQGIRDLADLLNTLATEMENAS